MAILGKEDQGFYAERGRRDFLSKQQYILT